MDDVIALYKPRGISSNNFLTLVKKKTGIQKIGHAGTLDPLAEGVLVIGLGKGTKKLNLIIKNEKEYEATVRLGIESSTDDEEGEKTVFMCHPRAGGDPVMNSNLDSRFHGNDRIKCDELLVGELAIKLIEEKLKEFIGQTEQRPPIYSAVKYQGREAYKWTREGKSVELKPRLVEIKEIEIIDYQWP
ncbi:hypothetical protein HY061_02125, partial [Candidatus Azambacteria bacterium]|nr:hypothetical protein [Candidatus Azambacteria bacterium]